MIWKPLPAEGQAPVKVAPVVVLAIRGWFHELKGVEVDRGDVRAHYCRVVLCYPGQQRLQPSIKAFTCLDHRHFIFLNNNLRRANFGDA